MADAVKTNRPRVTQKEVATAAGVSQMTVSYALRGSDLVKPDTRRAVLEAAKSLGYRTNASAKAIRQGRAGCVAIIESTKRYRSSFFGGALFDGIESALTERDIHISVARISDEALSDEDFVPKILREYTADGLLINYIADIPPRLIELIDRYQIPSTWINSKQEHNCVYLDDYAGGREATRHLIELGHRRIGYLDYQNYPPTMMRDLPPVHYSIVDRRRGYTDAMLDAGLEPMLVYDGKSRLSPTEALEFSRGWLAQSSRPTGVVAFNGPSALKVIHAAVCGGLDVPRDLSVIAFEDFSVADTGVALTVMRQRFQQLGAAASRMLLRRLEHLPDCPDQEPEVLPFELTPGATCAPPASS